MWWKRNLFDRDRGFQRNTIDQTKVGLCPELLLQWVRGMACSLLVPCSDQTSLSKKRHMLPFERAVHVGKGNVQVRCLFNMSVRDCAGGRRASQRHADGSVLCCREHRGFPRALCLRGGTGDSECPAWPGLQVRMVQDLVCNAQRPAGHSRLWWQTVQPRKTSNSFRQGFPLSYNVSASTHSVMLPADSRQL